MEDFVLRKGEDENRLLPERCMGRDIQDMALAPFPELSVSTKTAGGRAGCSFLR